MESVELTGFWLAAGRLCSVISVVVPIVFIAFWVVLLMVAAVRVVAIVVRAIVHRVVLRERIESHIESCGGRARSRGGGHLWS